MKRFIVNVSTDSWVKGQIRLCQRMADYGERVIAYSNTLPRGCPPHRTRGVCAGRRHADCVPYAFKAYALHEVATQQQADMLLWCDASIVPIRPLDSVWRAIEERGVWICRNGWSNAEWTADSAYPDLFPDLPMDRAREVNAEIPHVVATTFGLDLRQQNASALLAAYYRLASTTRAFCGPWGNSAAPHTGGRNVDREVGLCGPPTTLGHRHDQTALSVLAWTLGVQLDEVPARFAYKGGESDSTVLVAEGI